MTKFCGHKRHGFSLMELLAVVTILGIIAAIIVPRVAVSSDTAKTKVRSHHKATINAAVERWYIETGAWPANDLSDIGADVNYFPDGIPVSPVGGLPRHRERVNAGSSTFVLSGPDTVSTTKDKATVITATIATTTNIVRISNWNDAGGFDFE